MIVLDAWLLGVLSFAGRLLLLLVVLGGTRYLFLLLRFFDAKRRKIVLSRMDHGVTRHQRRMQHVLLLLADHYQQIAPSSVYGRLSRIAEIHHAHREDDESMPLSSCRSYLSPCRRLLEL
jgi:hypothetical protein